MLTDTHCHLDFNNFEADREAVISRAWDAGLYRILVPGVDIYTSKSAVQLTDTYSNIYAAVGIHPNSSLSWDSQSENNLITLAKRSKVVAIGEIGLDYYRDKAPRDHQKRILQNQLNLAEKLNLPVIIHTRNVSDENRACIKDTIGILSEWKSKHLYPGVVHSFSGDEKEAKRLISLDFLIGITGPITYKNGISLRRVVASVPLESLLIETDGPFLTPHPHRGKRNEPSYVRYITEKIGEVKQQSIEAVALQTSKNAENLFKWGGTG
jgi:TatD DNase family protein